jgi:hypothetical protein
MKYVAQVNLGFTIKVSFAWENRDPKLSGISPMPWLNTLAMLATSLAELIDL